MLVFCGQYMYIMRALNGIYLSIDNEVCTIEH